MQGIADGAVGIWGLRQYQKHIGALYRGCPGCAGCATPDHLNVAYMTNTLWSGLFGAHHVNEGTEDVWVGTLA